MALIPALAARGLSIANRSAVRPELHDGFRGCAGASARVIDRCNPILFEPGHKIRAIPGRSKQVEVVASMPRYSAANVDKQRGDGVFDLSTPRCSSSMHHRQPGSAWC
jgi:hypothetical protein